MSSDLPTSSPDPSTPAAASEDVVSTSLAPTAVQEEPLDGTRFTLQQPAIIPLVLAAIVTFLALVTGVALTREKDPWQWACYGMAALSLAAGLLYRRQVLREEHELKLLKKALKKESQRQSEAEAELILTQETLVKEWASREMQQTVREKDLERKLLVYREWEEFPAPVSLAVVDAANEMTELAQKDRQMIELLQKKTELLYEKIRNNEYAADGKLDMALVRTDALQLAHDVAAIYMPKVTQPILETNAELILRAMGRASLQFLSLIEGLPLQVKDHSFASLYGYLRRGLSVYSTYRATEPYWPYLNTAYYLGRFALGANPLALSAWWFAGALSKQGAKMLVSHVVNRQAIGLLGNAVRIIGFEVANVYGGDFRHRDPNWIYAAELTELVSQFPLSRDSLSAALREVSTLELRSEYDRVFLCRCLAAQKGARPENYQASAVLNMQERRAIASRLEKFLSVFVHGKTAERVQTWKAAVEARLGVRMTGAGTLVTTGVREQQQDALRSLASFLLSMKECEPEDLPLELGSSSVLAELSGEEQKKTMAELMENPPYFFEYADLDVMSDLTGKYLRDLARLHVQRAPREVSLSQAVTDVAVYLGKTPRDMQQILDEELARVWQLRRGGDMPLAKVPTNASMAILDLLEKGDSIRFVYGGVTIDPPEVDARRVKENLWLVGVGERLVVIAIADRPRLVWHATIPVTAEVKQGILSSSCRLTGGVWATGEDAAALAAGVAPASLAKASGSKAAAICVSTSAIGSLANYLGPLLSVCKVIGTGS